MSQQAQWRWSGQDWNEVGKLATSLRDGTMITARIEDCDGDFGYWEVTENGFLVGYGQISSSDKLWRNGDGPKLEAERVICYGATEQDRNIADAELIRRSTRKRLTPSEM